MEDNRREKVVEASVSSAPANPMNAADNLIEIVRDSMHSHLNTVARIADMVIPKSLGTILRHEPPEYGAGSQLPGFCGSLAQIVRQTVRGIGGVSKVTENPESYSVQFVVPGWKPADLEILVNARGIAVKGRRTEPSGEVKLIPLGSWSSPESLDINDAKAKADQGILEATIYKSKEAQARKIEISPA